MRGGGGKGQSRVVIRAMFFDGLEVFHATIGLVECIHELSDVSESLRGWGREA
jgi:hypothetical protein